MPELPEVHTVVTDLNKYLSGYNILDIMISRSYKTLPNNTVFKKRACGKLISGVKRVAKNILIELSSEDNILIHLGMTGRVLLRDPSNQVDRWTRVILKIQKNNITKELRFTDTRKFGKMGVVGKNEILRLYEKYGPEPIDSTLTPIKFHEILRSKKTNIKKVLLDQKLISGLGNIYATDALFVAGINPQTQTSHLTIKMAGKLLKSARSVLEEGIKNRGSTMPDKAYLDIFGKEGTQQNSFKIYLKEICPKCKTKVSYIKLNGRGTYFCENCQPNANKKS